MKTKLLRANSHIAFSFSGSAVNLCHHVCTASLLSPFSALQLPETAICTGSSSPPAHPQFSWPCKRYMTQARRGLQQEVGA